MRISDALGRLTGGKVSHTLIGQQSHAGIQQSHIQMLPLAGHRFVCDRRADSDRGVHAGENIDHRHPHPHRTPAWHPIWFAGNTHQPGHALRHEIVTGFLAIRPGLTKPRHRAIHQTGVQHR